VEDTGGVRLTGLALVAVADVFPVFGAKGPKVVLEEPRKARGKRRIKLPAVNPERKVLNDPYATVFRVAAGPIAWSSW
jgi:hypothetical protein